MSNVSDVSNLSNLSDVSRLRLKLFITLICMQHSPQFCENLSGDDIIWFTLFVMGFDTQM